MSNSNNEDVILLVKNMMSLFGLWPKSDTNYVYKLKKIICWIVTCIQTVFMVGQLIKHINSIDTVTDVLCLMATYVSFLIKFAIFEYKLDTVTIIMQDLQQDTFKNYPNEFDHYMQSTIKLSNLIVRMYQVICFNVITIYSLKPIFINEGQRLPIEVSFQVESYYYYVLYAFESTSLLINAWNHSSLDALAMGLMSIASAQLDILREKLLSLTKYVDEEVEKNESVKEQIENAVKDCVVHHMGIIKYVENIENVFSYGFLTQYADSILVICTIGFQVAHASSLQFILMILYFIAMIMQLSLYCWFGNNVIYKSESIKDACYHINWYNYDLNVRKSLFIIMERSKRPLKLTAKKFADLSLIAFMSIMRSSYSYFAVMQRMYANSQHAGHRN